MLFQHPDAGRVTGATYWTTWVSSDGVAWVQKIVMSNRFEGGRQVTEMRWRVALPEGWWREAERLVGKHRFLGLRVDRPPDREGVDAPEIVVIPRMGNRVVVSKWENDRVGDFDPLYDHLKSLRKQAETTEPTYKGAEEPDWHPEGFPSKKEARQK
jgi:hypothetical protein